MSLNMKNNLQQTATMLLSILLLFSPAAQPSTTHTPEPLTHGEEPQVLPVLHPCGGEHDGYCVHGKCSYTPDLNTPTCQCDSAYSGPRCEFVSLFSWRTPEPEEIIGITAGVLLLLGCIAVLVYFCYVKRCWNSSPPYRNYSQNSV